MSEEERSAIHVFGLESNSEALSLDAFDSEADLQSDSPGAAKSAAYGSPEPWGAASESSWERSQDDARPRFPVFESVRPQLVAVVATAVPRALGDVDTQRRALDEAEELDLEEL